MTKQEFIDRYGDVDVKFSYYYKHSFHFDAELPDGSGISVAIGGESGEIYRLEVDCDEVSTVKDLDPYSGGIYKEGKEICSFYDY